MASAVRPENNEFLDEVISSPGREADLSVVPGSKTGTAFFSAGDPVPAPGSYWVWHKHHREAHAAKVRFTTFPACAKCGESVRYIAVDESESTASEWLRRDPDFRHALIRKGKGKAPAQDNQL